MLYSVTELNIGGNMNGESKNLYEILRFTLSVLIISTLILGGSLFGQVHAAIPAIERAALIAFYSSTDGDNWSDNSGWNGALGTECSWYGVTCTGDSVTELSLITNQLTGSIPAELGNLTNLQYLNLRTNRLTGSIPAELGNLTNLQALDLWNTRLTGSIPAELGNLTNLKYLRLYNNQLTDSIPAELGNLANLQILYLGQNQLTGSIPAELGNLTNLRRLYLHHNPLTGSIPAELGNLTNLQRLNLSTNQLTGSIPVELMNMTSLEFLEICDNHLYTSDPDLRDFLDIRQPGWESCQTPPFGTGIPANPGIPILLLGE
jgi:Leucine-rich repeat (LRR) protein